MTARKPCHNCRRNRRRCDRSVPSCNKCRALGQDCLGYGQLLRWTDSIASRGHMKGKATYANKPKATTTHPESHCQFVDSSHPGPWPTHKLSPTTHVLVDPVFQDLDTPSKFYLNYYSSRLARELVVHDYVGINPFKDLVPMSATHTFLRPIVIAVSALHYSNVIRRSAPDDRQESAASIGAMVYALQARHSAIKALQSLLNRWQHEGLKDDNQLGNRPAGERDAFLAAVVFFINFALIDSGGGGWQAHLGTAGRLLIAQAAGRQPREPLKPTGDHAAGSEACLANLFPQSGSVFSTSTDGLVCSSQRLTVGDYVASDAVAYYVWKSTLDSLIISPTVMSSGDSPDDHADAGLLELDPDSILPIVLRTEANCYHSCPAALLHIMLRASQLVRRTRNASVHTTTEEPSSKESRDDEETLPMFMNLLLEAQAFDADAWAAEMSARNAHELVSHVPAEVEMMLRMHIATVYRATACLYLLLAAPGLYRYVERLRLRQPAQHNLPTLPRTSELADQILNNLSMFDPESPFFKYTTWPVFMTGVEAGPHGDRRAWVIARLQRMYDNCPWGMLKSAMDVLVQIWKIRDQATLSEVSRVDGLKSEVGSPDDEKIAVTAPDSIVLYSSQSDDDIDWLSKLRGLKIDCLIV